MGVSLAEEKTEGPSVITYLGFTLDTDLQELRLPSQELSSIRVQLAQWLNGRHCTKRELLSLIGTLKHCCQAVVHGRPFLRSLIDRASSVPELFYHVDLSPWERERCCMVE